MSKTMKIAGAVDSAFGWLTDGVTDLFESGRPREYSSRFARPGEVGLSRWNKGFCLDGVHAITAKASFSNAAVFGSSGSGKSSCVIIPSVWTLSRGGCSMVIHDVNKEIQPAVAPFLVERGYEIMNVNLSDPRYSESFNPLEYAQTPSAIARCAHLHVKNSLGDTKGEKFWNSSSEMLYSLMARYLVGYAAPQYRNIGNVLRLVEALNGADGELLDKLFVKTGDESLISGLKATLAMGDRTLGSVVQNTRSVLSLFTDECILQSTARNTIDFKRLRTGEKPLAIFITTPLMDATYLSALSALFFESLFNSLLAKLPEPHERSVYVLIDESSSITISALSHTISNARKFRCGLMLLVQDFQAWVAQYGQPEAHNIKTNANSQVFMPGQNLESCKQLAEILGKWTYKDEKGIERSRSLMSVDEIRTCPDAIILLGNKLPVRARLRPYYTSSWYRRVSALPRYEFPEKDLIDPPMIPLE